jgi:hypothetical protein
MITAITPTGDRPLALALCQRWVSQQTRPPDQWLVIDDGVYPAEPYVSMEYVRRERRPEDPPLTLIANLRAALPLIRGDMIVILEDDEYYAPGYLAAFAAQLTSHEVVGIRCSKYYHLPTGRWANIGNHKHASLAQTGFRSSFLPSFAKALAGDTYLDIRLWRAIGSRGFLFGDERGSLYLGIKGLPGRPGIGMGHNPKMYRCTDPHRSILRQYTGADSQIYFDILSGALTTENYKAYFRWA